MAIICDAMKLLLRQQQHHYCSVLLGTIFILTACYSGAGREDTLLARVDSLMNDRPDSALVVLATISSPRELSSAQFARYALLLTQAHDKSYITHADDSLIRVAVNYYDSIEDVGLQAKAHYYWGRVHQDRKNIAPCVREYLMAISLAEKAEENYLSCLAYSNLGYIFCQEDLNDKADSCFQQAKWIAQQHKDSTQLAIILVNQGLNYLAKGESAYPMAEECLNRALVIAETTRNWRIDKLATLLLSTLYSRLGNGEKAVLFAKKNIALSDKQRCFGAYLLLGDGYYKLEKYDSAKVYLTKSLPTRSYDTKLGAYMRLSEIAELEGRYQEAVTFARFVTVYQDSVKNYNQHVAVISAVKDVQIYTISQKHTHSVMQFNYLLLFGGAALTLLVAFFLYKRKKYSQSLRNAQIERKKLREQLVCEVEQKSIELEQLQESLNQHVVSGAEVQLLRERMQLLENDRSMIIKSLISNSEILLKMQRIIDYYRKYNDYTEHFDSEDWRHFIACIDPLGKFQKYLMTCHESLLEDEIHLCYLLKVNFSIIDISIIMGCTRDNIYKKKRLIANKLSSSSEDSDLKEVLEQKCSLF